jgi:lauroyl/myristoyl acyltransferase
MALKPGASSPHRWYSFHVAGRCFALAMRLVPRRHRFGTALLLARAATPFIRRTQAYDEQRKTNVDGVGEIALHFVLNNLTKHGTTFDPVIAVNGFEALERALAKGRGVLLITPHTVLSILAYRFIYDAGLNPVGVAVDPELRVSGTRVATQMLQPTPTFLLEVRSLLRGGRLVCAMVDRGEHQEGRTIEFDTAGGKVIVATALMQVAARCGAEVAFYEAHCDGRGVVANFAAPAPESMGSADAVTRDFAEFVRAHVGTRSVKHN